ncbi:MAG: 2-hydroxyacid dehydrogenase [Planctomycetota bacterium]|nr:2-hydroxyacid dehydrogenase [Planctomycetota bacterium]
MKVAVFSAKPYDKAYLEAANAKAGHELLFLEPHLNDTTVVLAQGHQAVCAFVNDQLNANVIGCLKNLGVRFIAMRCAGYNNVDVKMAKESGIAVARVPAYSPYAVAEHAVALMLALNRKIVRATHRIREGNFALDGLLGFDMHGRVAGIVGTGKIGAVVAQILKGFGCRLLAYDKFRNPACEALGVTYVELPELLAQSDIVTLHCPLLPATYHLINGMAVEQMKKGVMLINTSRGALIDTPAAIQGLKDGKIGSLGLDVYEEEGDLFFEDKSGELLQDDVFARLLTFPNVVITGHQAFFTEEALSNIAETTIGNLTAFENGVPSGNEVKA